MLARKWIQLGIGSAAALLAGCSPHGGQAPGAAAPQDRSPAAVDPALAARVKAINEARFVASANGASSAAPQAPGASAVAPSAPDPALIKIEVLLARAHASPGEIDGLAGSNLQRAVAAYEQMNGLPGDGALNEAVWDRLNTPGQAPVAAIYVLTAQDVAGPYYPDVGDDMVAASKLPATGYARPTEMLAERFHMSERLLQALNPGADYRKPGAQLVVAQPLEPPVAPVDHIDIDKASASVRAYGADGTMIASFPATVGSTERPSPSGVHRVLGVSFNPTYTYDPSKLTWGPKRHGKFIVRPGPNNPVGLVWIDLSEPGYGIHGSPDPGLIGKTASHGCVRLTNWDALALSHAVKPGVVASFVNERGGR
jgi:lipoprotein-anchoring transpeptidase ErfK/SrfK